MIKNLKITAKTNKNMVSYSVMANFSSNTIIQKCINRGTTLMFNKYNVCMYLCHVNKTYQGRLASASDIYDILVNWGLARLGKNACPKNSFQSSIKTVSTALNTLQKFSLTDFLNSSKLPIIQQSINDIFNNLKLANTKNISVYYSKALHLFLPNLIIPMDNKYTLKYMHKSSFDLNTLMEYHIQMANLYCSYLPLFSRLQVSITTPNCSYTYPITKLLDNMVIGY